MGFLDVFKATENEALRNKIDTLQKELNEKDSKVTKLEQMVTPEMKDLEKIQKEISNHLANKDELIKSIADLEKEYSELKNSLSMKNNEIIDIDERIYMNDIGIYKPRYDLNTSEEYKIKINSVIEEQKLMIKNGTAFKYNPNWTVDNSKATGKKMSKSLGKQAIKSLNLEFEVLKQKVKHNNIDAIETKLLKSFNTINEANNVVHVVLSKKFCELKLKELRLYFELEIKKKDEKERRLELARQLREEEKVKKELEERKKNILKDQKHYNKELARILKLLEKASDDEFLLSEKARLEEELNEIDDKIKDIDYRQDNQKAGYVYIISNEGAFGKNIFKIGMTRRLEPLDRIKELSGASVPFVFNVHCLIFTDDAPALEHELHKYFAENRVNKINNRKEFFKIQDISELKEVIKQKTNESFGFIDNPITDDFFPCTATNADTIAKVQQCV